MAGFKINLAPESTGPAGEWSMPEVGKYGSVGYTPRGWLDRQVSDWNDPYQQMLLGSQGMGPLAGQSPWWGGRDPSSLSNEDISSYWASQGGQLGPDGNFIQALPNPEDKGLLTGTLSNFVGPGLAAAAGGLAFSGAGIAGASEFLPFGESAFLAGQNPLSILEEVGNFTGGGLFGGDRTFGQILGDFGFNTDSLFRQGASKLFGALSQPTGGTSGGPGGIGFGSPIQALASIGSGIYGMTLADKQRKLAEEQAKMISRATSAADPWGTSGGRAAAARDLALLNTDPTAAMAKDPRFAAMVQAAQRATAAYGQNSGAMNVAGAQAGGNWYTQRMAELSGLAGVGNAGIPGQGAVSAGQISLTGNQEANTLAGRSLADIGFGINTATGGSVNIPLAVRIWLQQQGVRV